MTLQRLQRSFEQQRRFTSDAAHELKTDLAIVKSSFQLLSMKQRTVEEYEAGISLGLQDIARSEATVHRMLTLARLEQTSKDELSQCDLAAVVTEAIAQSEPLAAIRNVKVIFQPLSALPIVALSQEDALLLCSNVLMNALQFSPNGASVQVDLTDVGPFQVLSVKDEGPGIAKEDEPFLFTAFYRGDASRNRLTGGTGLGLSICRAICNRAGGRITIANGPAGGAIVEIRLPNLADGGAQ
jgi:signal transduction histidine kinase